MPSNAHPDPAAPLLAFLREHLTYPGLSYKDSPAQLLGGNETTIYAFQLADAPSEAWSGPLILRIQNRRDSAPGQCAFESTVQNALADAGLPVPRALVGDEDPDVVGGPFFVMERVPGEVMLPDLSPLTLLLGLRNFIRVIPRRFAEVHARFLQTPVDGLSAELTHNPASKDLLTYEAWFRAIRTNIDEWSLDGLREGLRWVETHAGNSERRTAICHGDFHPLNILEEQRVVTGIIDWSKPCIGEAEFDVGNTRVVLDLVTLDLPKPLLRIGRWLQQAFLRTYLERIHELVSLDAERVRYGEAVRCLRELSALEAVEVQRRRGVAVVDGTAPASWDMRRLADHFRKITGVEIRLTSA